MISLVNCATLPQVIALVDSRLIKLENKSNENIDGNFDEENGQLTQIFLQACHYRRKLSTADIYQV